jgi:uncharacterized protein YraI
MKRLIANFFVGIGIITIACCALGGVAVLIIGSVPRATPEVLPIAIITITQSDLEIAQDLTTSEGEETKSAESTETPSFTPTSTFTATFTATPTKTVTPTKFAPLATNTRRPTQPLPPTNTKIPTAAPTETNTAIPTFTPVPPTAAPQVIIVTATSAPIVIVVTNTPQIVVVTSFGPATYKITAESGLNIRSGPGTNYAALGRLSSGDTVEIIGRNANSTWWQIKQGALTGWVINGAEYGITNGDVSKLVVVAAPPPDTSIVSSGGTTDNSSSNNSASNSSSSVVPSGGVCPVQPEPKNCDEAVKMNLSAEQAALCRGTNKNGERYDLDNDHDGKACYGN